MHYRRIPILSNLKVIGGLFMVLILFAVQCDASDLSNCKKRIRHVIKRQGYYIQNFNDTGHRHFPKRLKKFVTGLSLVDECCDGYSNKTVEEGTVTRCIPVCPSHCDNGRCYRPNECVCDLGYSVSLNNLTGYSECISSCQAQCRGGRCIGPNTCACEPGYVLSEDRSSCKALCITVGGGGPHGCGDNASCVAPNTCKCHHGYENNPNDSLPVCLSMPNTSYDDPNAFSESLKKRLCNTSLAMNGSAEEEEGDNDDDEDDDDDNGEETSNDSLWTVLLYDIVGALLGSVFGGAVGSYIRRFLCCIKKKESRITVV